MYIADQLKDYTILDTGNGMKLERWGDVILSRPDPQVIWPRSRPDLWKKADAVYLRSREGGGNWDFKRPLPESWVFSYKNLRFNVRPTGFKHTGIFPEQSINWDYMDGSLSGRGQTRILNLFAYTGGATAACAAAGASVTHVDAAKSMVAWAKQNLMLSGLAERPVRYIVDDCLKFVLREIRRGNVYDGIVMDPPSYGRGSGGSVWKMEDDLFGLVQETAKLLSPDPAFFILNSYTTGLSSVVTQNLLEMCVCPAAGGRVEAGDLVIPVENSGVLLPCGTTARWHR